MILLTDEEMKALKPDVPMCTQTVFDCEGCSAQCGLTAKAQLKKVVDEMEKPCFEHGDYAVQHRRQCPECWQTLKKECDEQERRDKGRNSKCSVFQNYRIAS